MHVEVTSRESESINEAFGISEKRSAEISSEVFKVIHKGIIEKSTKACEMFSEMASICNNPAELVYGTLCVSAVLETLGATVNPSVVSVIVGSE